MRCGTIGDRDACYPEPGENDCQAFRCGRVYSGGPLLAIMIDRRAAHDRRCHLSIWPVHAHWEVLDASPILSHAQRSAADALANTCLSIECIFGMMDGEPKSIDTWSSKNDWSIVCKEVEMIVEGLGLLRFACSRPDDRGRS